MKQNYDDNELDGLFRDKLAGEQVTPREMVWDKIEKQLDVLPRRSTGWMWWLSGIILVLGLGTWLGISTFQKNQLAQHSKATGWNYNDPKNGGFDKSSYQGGEGDVKIEGGAYSKDSANSQNNNSSAVNSSSDNSSDNSSDKTSASQNNSGYNSSDNKSISKNNSNTNTISSSDKNSTSASFDKNSTKKNSSHFKSDAKSNSIYSDKPTFEKNNPPLPPSSSLLINHSDNPDKNSTEADSKDTRGSNHEGSVFSLPKKLGDFNKPVDTVKANSPMLLSPPTDSSVAKKDPKIFVDQDHSTLVNDVPAHTDSLPEKNTMAKNDSTKSPGQDSSGTLPILPPPSPLPIFYVALHAGVDNETILSSEESYVHPNNTDVRLYDKNKLKSLPQQTNSYGLRFGWFLSKRFSLTAGAYYSIFQSAPSEGHFKFNHNESYIFTMHSATSSVECKSSNFGYGDSNGGMSDTFYVALRSEERYDYVNLQLGVSYYAVRTKYFGLYANLLSNGACLAKEQMTLTVPKSGKSWSFGPDRMSGMNKFVLGGQVGIGAEFILGGHLGLWAEPSYFFSGVMNRNNAMRLQPGGMRYLFGLTYHF